jgi:riboflavin kinase/FMN adenylyltransferase
MLHTRARYLSLLGVQQLYVQKFDLAFSKIEAAVFIEKILVQQLVARHVVVGENFHFGHRRHGDINFLVEQSAKYGFGVTPVVPARMTTGQIYSSSRARELLQAGDPQGARQILGRPFEIEGMVERGEGLARGGGFPTANMQIGNYLRPKYGVYAVRAAAVGPAAVPQWYNGVANLGIRPTFRGGQELLESHLFDFNGDLYDQRLRVQLWHYLRPEEKFGKVDALRAQITKDAAEARAKLAQ